MAQRRMFSLKIVDTDQFLDMPISTRLLYYDLAMRADDDGFIASPKKITKIVGCGDDDLKLLTAKQFIIPFQSGVCVIKDWRIHNYIQKDRYQPTQYQEEASALQIDKNGAYTPRIQDVSKMDTQVRLELGKSKDRLEIEKIPPYNPPTGGKEKNFVPPTAEEVAAYCRERQNDVCPESFVDFYESKGWLIGKTKMRDWKAAVRTWERNGRQKRGKSESDNIFLRMVREGALRDE